MALFMHQLLDLDRYPLHDLKSGAGQALVESCRQALAADGMFNLEGLVKPSALAECLVELAPLWAEGAFTHRRTHNIYFDDDVPELPAAHPALKRFETVNQTICADQIPGNALCRIYEWPKLAAFLAAVTGTGRLYPMSDPLARVNIMAYRAGEALNWHFDRAEFTTTLLLQAPNAGGAFQYRRDLRTASEANYDGVAGFLADPEAEARTCLLTPGTLNLFKGKYSAHRVTPVAGARPRIIAIFSYYQQPGIRFGADERREFYGRSETMAPDGSG